LTRSLGQNFLHDANQLRRIVAAAELSPCDPVLEIGPGLGPLTELLLARAAKVLAIEKDARLVAVLRERFPASGYPHLELVHADALEWLRQAARDWREWKVVSNLPYSVASPILVELAQSPQRPERLVVTVQLEVAQRLLAQPRTGDFGLLTLLVQLDYEPGPWFRIPRRCFFPEPEVDSACVVLRRRQRALAEGAARETFLRLVRRAFSQRRKMMFKLLKADWPEGRLAGAFDAAGIPLQSRAEEVGLEQFVRLARGLTA
ncbi:MAG: 16S rRNA (adenine(1518)-N(6)/adenine(1519)-N(6))-dimethyltransferase RsmA, partial [Verrucomicrobiales bacterium]|nr:16S rRNA (adenine(1518)-N(6)/adenine(1519)-N(6))-dimethyltransferase RsmA [Verrucomicrobiales bacterium]